MFYLKLSFFHVNAICTPGPRDKLNVSVASLYFFVIWSLGCFSLQVSSKVWPHIWLASQYRRSLDWAFSLFSKLCVYISYVCQKWHFGLLCFENLAVLGWSETDKLINYLDFLMDWQKFGVDSQLRRKSKLPAGNQDSPANVWEYLEDCFRTARPKILTLSRLLESCVKVVRGQLWRT